MQSIVHFRGPIEFRLRSMAVVSQSIVEVGIRRAQKGPHRPGWNWFMELGTEILKRQVRTAFEMHDVGRARLHLDSFLFGPAEIPDVTITHLEEKEFRGSWFLPKTASDLTTMLYFHGGGYSFYPQAYANFVALLARITNTRIFALDYRLTPQHRFPAQLKDAVQAYRWLLNHQSDGSDLIVAGDSAGGNLTLALLLAARDESLPMPALAIALSPPTDFESDRLQINDLNSDWIDKPMLEQWADWFCDLDQRRNPLVSPWVADLRGLPPIYLQAGRAEILYDSIQAFADRARGRGADVVLESWEDMNHDFQLFGPYVWQSREALQRVREIIDARVRKPADSRTVAN